MGDIPAVHRCVALSDSDRIFQAVIITQPLEVDARIFDHFFRKIAPVDVATEQSCFLEDDAGTAKGVKQGDIFALELSSAHIYHHPREFRWQHADERVGFWASLVARSERSDVLGADTFGDDD